MDERIVLGNNDIDDVRRLCSLFEFDLDLLMGLKSLVNMRAKQRGDEGGLAKKFNLRMLLGFGFMFMESLKGQLKAIPGGSDIDSNLLKRKLSDNFARMTMEDLYPYVCSDSKKRVADMFSGDIPPQQKRKRRRETKQMVALADIISQTDSLDPGSSPATTSSPTGVGQQNQF